LLGTWNIEHGIWIMEYWNMEYGIWNIGTWNMEYWNIEFCGRDSVDSPLKAPEPGLEIIGSVPNLMH
jgi:hypothetical protein